MYIHQITADGDDTVCTGGVKVAHFKLAFSGFPQAGVDDPLTLGLKEGTFNGQYAVVAGHADGVDGVVAQIRGLGKRGGVTVL